MPPPASRFADPPWGGPPGFGIGLRRIPTGDWLEGGEARPWVRKDRLFRTVPDKVWGETEGSRPGQAEVAEMIRQSLGLRPGAPDRPPLLEAARRVPDDLVLMEKPEPGFRDRFQVRVRRIFDRLPADQILERRNWTVTAWSRLYAPEAAAARRRALALRPGLPGAGLNLRCERQTLRRLPRTGGVLFTIRIHLTPLRDLADAPEAVRIFARAWAEAPEDFRGYKGLAALAPGVEAFLADCAAPGPQTVTDFREESPS